MSDTSTSTPSFKPFILPDGTETKNLDGLSIDELDAERRRVSLMSKDPQMDDLSEETLRYFLEIGSRLRTNTVGPAKPKPRRGGAEVADLF